MMTLAAAPAVIDPTRHARLLEDLDHVCHVANIPKQLIYTSAVGTCNDVELDWVRRFRAYQAAGEGLLLIGKHVNSPDKKMSAMAAAFLRNFIDARVMSINTVLDLVEEGEDINATVLMIPNFYVQLAQGRTFPAYKISRLYDMLLTRASQSKMNVLYVSNMDAMKNEYGDTLKDHLATYKKSQED